MMDQSAHDFLLALARHTIRTKLGLVSQMPDLVPLPKGKFGAFVTLHKEGQLRGCIGFIEGRLPLDKTITQMAASAAFDDPRFSEVKAKEVDDLHIEISVLTPIEACPDPKMIVIGRHGLYLTSGHNGGVFLPQVPVEQGWDLDQYLQFLCRKAGLPSNAWKDSQSKLYWFEAEVFAES